MVKKSSSFTLYFYLYAYFLIVILQILSIFGNVLTIFLFFKSNNLRKNTSLRLIFLLAITDGLFAICAFPYTLNYIINWNPVELNYDPLFVLTAGLPMLIQFKINLVFILSIALDRYQAIRYPIYYLEKNHVLYSIVTLILGVSFAALDIVFEFAITRVKPVPGCAAIGCFTSKTFNAHWGASNMLLSTFGIVLSVLVICESCRQSKPTNYNTTTNNDTQYEQSSYLSSCLMISGISCMMLPSVLVGLGEIGGLQFIRKFGLFYMFCLLLVGVINSVIYTVQHNEIKKAVREIFCGETVDRRIFMTPIVPLTRNSLTLNLSFFVLILSTRSSV